MTRATSRNGSVIVALCCGAALTLGAAPAVAATSRSQASAPSPLAGDGHVVPDPGHAAYEFDTLDLRIPVDDPDLYGNPVTLDARVLVPRLPAAEQAAAGNVTPRWAGLLINHGYLGDKTGDGGTAEAAARRGFVVLRYSSRGFGDTPGQVDLVGQKEIDDMVTAVHWLNRQSYTWAGHIGQYGGSYGGAHAYQLARLAGTVVPEVKTVVAAATWNDLSTGLVPNKVLKLSYLAGFYAAGKQRTDGSPGTLTDQAYDNYDPEIDTAYAKVNSGVDVDGVISVMRSHSVVGHYDDITVPVFLAQGLNDGLFDANEAIESYDELAARHVPVRLYLGGLGHPPAEASDGDEIKRVTGQVVDWLDHYVRGVDNGVETQSPVEFAETKYFDNVVDDPTFGADRVHAATSTTFGSKKTMTLCPATVGQTVGTIQAGACASPAVPGVLAAGAGGSVQDEPVTRKALEQGYQQYFHMPYPDASTKTPSQVLSYDTLPYPADTLLAGIPTLHLSVLSDPPTTGLGGPTPPAAAYQVDPKIYDVSPDGTATLLTRGAFAEQPGEGAPGVHTASFDVFAFAWKVPAGHRLRLELNSADAPYLKPNPAAFQVLVMPTSTFDVPTGDASTAPLYRESATAAPAVMPEVPFPALLLGVGVVAVLLVTRRRQPRKASA